MRWIHALPVAALLLATACQSMPQSVTGDWSYHDNCGAGGFGHIATLSLQQQGDQITGDWSEGDGRGRGEFGDLTGQVRDGKAYLRFCVAWEDGSEPACPAFGEEEAYVVRKGGKLLWFQPFGTTEYERYLTMHLSGTPQDPDDQPECQELWNNVHTD